MRDEWLAIGHLGKPHGLNGAMFLHAEDHRSELGPYRRLRLEIRGHGRVVEVTSAFTSRSIPVVKLAEVPDRTAAEELVGAKVFVHRDDVPAEDVDDEDVFLIDDLVGLRVSAPEHGTLGEVVAVYNFGAQDTLEIALTGTGRKVLFPFLDQYVHQVDLEGGEIVIEYVAEFFEE